MKFKIKAYNDVEFSNSNENLKEDEKRFTELYECLTDFIKYQENRVTSPSGYIFPEDKKLIDKLKDVQDDLYSFLVNLQYED